ncbi:MAG: hypothetical protein WCA63_02750 [Gallionella sp.]
MPILVALLLSGCSVFGGSQQSCKILDPDLAQGTYRGGCKDGWADGYGEVDVYQKSGGISSYRGDFLDGKKHGKGIKVMPNGDRYTGDFRDDYRDGQGIYVWGDKTPWAGDRYEGEYRRDLRNGWGVYQWASGDRYEGAWENDLRIGSSVMELRRAQAAEAVARSVKTGAMVCADERWDKVKNQRIRGIVESVKDKMVQVQIVEVEGGIASHQGATLATGDLLVDEVAHWQLCGQN